MLRAVAVWGAMAAAQVEARGPVETRLRLERLRRTIESVCRIEAEAELRAERAARRKWELRLRWRFAGEPGAGRSTMDIYRRDTGELVYSRPMTDSEQRLAAQASLWQEPAPTVRTTTAPAAQ